MWKSVWMDQGGTFTDVVRLDSQGRLKIDKILSDRVDLDALAMDSMELRRGTTVATNALLEGQGVPTLLVTTCGVADLPWIGDQTRPDLFSLAIQRNEPLCRAVVEASGRISARGDLQGPVELDESRLQHWLDRGIHAVAIVLVHGPLEPEAEKRLGRLCMNLGFTQVSLGHEVAPSRGFLARLQTTLVDAALSPLLPRARGHYMRSDGGLAWESGAGVSEWRGCHAVLSGPAGGVVATADLARREGLNRVIGFDMGGTSTDVSRVEGKPERTDHLLIAGRRLRVPALRLETVAAGGGSVLQVHAGLYQVGPRSAGSDPGPACYGRGGPAAVTDAEAVLGRLPAFPRVCGVGRDQDLDIDAARRALQSLDPTRSVEAVAQGFREVAHETMAAAIRRLAAAQGVDPASHALVAFGGAGPGHACGVARRLGIGEIWIPRAAGVFSAVGIGMARRRAERVEPIGPGGLPAAVEKIRSHIPFEGEMQLRLAARHQGTSELIEIGLRPGEETRLASLRARFDAAHRQRFGFTRPEASIVPVELRMSVEEPGEERPQVQIVCSAPSSRVRAFFGTWQEVPLCALEDGDGLAGPALIQGPGCTVVIEPGWRAELHSSGLCLRATAMVAARAGMEFDSIHTAVLGARLMGIAEQMGERLARLARSVSIRERRDFSCAVFDGAGQLVCNAPHIPVHLGAMGETIRTLVREHGPELAAGQHWLCNDPYAGGSHLPDITVMAPIFVPGESSPLLFVACRGHHIDVGGISPGSMPPHSRHIDEEGIRIPPQLLAEEGRFLPPELPGCRQPAEVRADLEAQVAACSLGREQICGLVEELGADVLRAQLGHLMDQAERAICALLAQIEAEHPAGHRFSGTEVLDDGTPISVTIQISGGRARVEIDAPAHPGNLNAPRAVARAALLYVFRCLVEEPLPLNEGALRPFDLHIEPGGLFDPQPPAAVAGGNVESSQRLVDALLQALGRQAGSQGTMNNLTIGTSGGTLYETIGGGSGATMEAAGADGVQVHMTNTQATDIEELEHRLPLVLESWCLRRGSGGEGRLGGGEGVEKIWRFEAPAEVSILAGRRDRGAPGMDGGGTGLPGEDLRKGTEGWARVVGSFQAQAGERLCIRTPGGGGTGERPPILSNPERHWTRAAASTRAPPKQRARIRLGFIDGEVTRLAGGLANDNLALGDGRVLRIYERDGEALAKEARLLSQPWQRFRVPRLLESGSDFLVLEEMSLGPVLGSASHGRAAGEALAEIHGQIFEEAGFLGGDLRLERPIGNGDDALAEHVEAVRGRCPGHAILLGRWLDWAHAQASSIQEICDRAVLLHGDFKASNLFWSEDHRLLVLDWEFAWAGPALMDIGQILRWEPPLEFERALLDAYQCQGGILPERPGFWARQLDFCNLAGMLEHSPAGSRRELDLRARMERLVQEATR